MIHHPVSPVVADLLPDRASPRHALACGRLDGRDESDDVALGVAPPQQVRAQLLHPNPGMGYDLNGFAPRLRDTLGVALEQRAPPLADGRRGHRGSMGSEGRSKGVLAVKTANGTIKGFQMGGHRQRQTYVGPKHKTDLTATQALDEGAHKALLSTLPLMGNNQTKPDAFEFAKRLNIALDQIPACPDREKGKGRGAWLAALFKVSQPTTNGWLHGRYVPTPARVRVLATKAKVNYDWLYFGQGEMNNSGSATQVEPLLDLPPDSQTVRIESVMVASQVVAEVLEGAQITLPAAQHTEFLMLVSRWLDAGLPMDNVLQFARHAIPVESNRGNDGRTGGSTADTSNAG